MQPPGHRLCTSSFLDIVRCYSNVFFGLGNLQINADERQHVSHNLNRNAFSRISSWLGDNELQYPINEAGYKATVRSIHRSVSTPCNSGEFHITFLFAKIVQVDKSIMFSGSFSLVKLTD